MCFAHSPRIYYDQSTCKCHALAANFSREEKYTTRTTSTCTQVRCRNKTTENQVESMLIDCQKEIALLILDLRSWLRKRHRNRETDYTSPADE